MSCCGHMITVFYWATTVGPRWAPCWPHEPCYQGCPWHDSSVVVAWAKLWLLSCNHHISIVRSWNHLISVGILTAFRCCLSIGCVSMLFVYAIIKQLSIEGYLSLMKPHWDTQQCRELHSLWQITGASWASLPPQESISKLIAGINM